MIYYLFFIDYLYFISKHISSAQIDWGTQLELHPPIIR